MHRICKISSSHEVLHLWSFIPGINQFSTDSCNLLLRDLCVFSLSQWLEKAPYIPYPKLSLGLRNTSVFMCLSPSGLCRVGWHITFHFSHSKELVLQKSICSCNKLN